MDGKPKVDWLPLIAKIVILYLAFSCVGWVYEQVNDLIAGRGWIWRAALMGPWAPIYGIGGLLIVFAIGPLDRRLKASGMATPLRVLLVGLAIGALVTSVELAFSYICEWTMGSSPWDYSEYWGNFEGRIAPEFTLRFVLGGFAFLWLIEPAVSSWVDRHPKGAVALAGALLAVYLTDHVLEGMGVWASMKQSLVDNGFGTLINT